MGASYRQHEQRARKRFASPLIPEVQKNGCSNVFESETIAKQLVDEVVAWVRADEFFRPSRPPRLVDDQISFVLKDDSIWFKEIDINNEDSKFLTLNELLDEVEGAYRLVHQFGWDEFRGYVREATQEVCSRVGQSDSVGEFSQWLLRAIQWIPSGHRTMITFVRPFPIT